MPLNDNIIPPAYPSQYKQFIAEEDVEASAGRPRRLSYNHQRDVRFEAYRQEQPAEQAISSPGIPHVHVQHHDDPHIHEMENSRSRLT